MPNEVIVVDDEEESVFDDEQLDDYREMIEQLGGFPVRNC
jgi:hypothetical protein